MGARRKLGHRGWGHVALAALAVAAVLGSAGCQKLLGKKKPEPDTTTAAPTAAPAPDPSALKMQAAAKANIEAIRKQEEKLPRPTESLKPLGHGKIEVGGSKPNLAIVWVVPEELNQFEILSSHFDESDSKATLCSLARDKEWSELTEDDRAALEVCAGFTYALFVHVKAYKKPEDHVQDDTFTPGFIDADVLLYDLGSGASLGGFAVKARSSKSFKADPLKLDAAAADLGLNLQDAIATRWEKLTKTKDFPHPTRPE